MLHILVAITLTWINDVTPFYAINVPNINLVLFIVNWIINKNMCVNWKMK
jgi:hypothetical protein